MNSSKNKFVELELVRKMTQSVLDTSADGFVLIDKRGTVRFYNKACKKMFGYDADEVIGENVKLLMPAMYSEHHDEYLSSYQRTGNKKIIGKGREVLGRRKDASEFPLDLTVTEVQVKGLLLYIGIIRDITKRQETESRLAAIMDNTVEGMITINEKGEIETFNKACETMFGYAAEEVIGENVSILMPDPYQRQHDGYLSNYHATGIKKVIGIGREVRGKRRDGTTFPLDASVSQVDVHGRKLYSGILRDITERHAAEKKLLDANKELEEFAYRTAHDLRSPLASAIGLLRLSDKYIKFGNKQALALKTLNKAQDALDQLDGLVQNISLLTRTKHEVESSRSVDVQELVANCWRKFESLENFDGLDIKTSFCGSDIVDTKLNRLVLIVENLISNAIKYQDPEKEEPWISVRTYINESDRYVFELKDNGLGIPAEFHSNLFAMFSRFHAKAATGSGLGLYMVKKSADIIGADLNYRDLEGGSLFEVVFPSGCHCRSLSRDIA